MDGKMDGVSTFGTSERGGDPVEILRS